MNPECVVLLKSRRCPSSRFVSSVVDGIEILVKSLFPDNPQPSEYWRLGIDPSKVLTIHNRFFGLHAARLPNDDPQSQFGDAFEIDDDNVKRPRTTFCRYSSNGTFSLL